MSLPDFLVIGAQRAGTSLLHQILLGHPEVYVPRERKEVHYFDRYFERGVAWYEGYFPAADAARSYRAIGEITPDYLATEEAPARIQVGRRGQDSFEGPSALRAIDLRTGDLVWDTDEIVTEDGDETVRRVDRMSFGRKNFCFTGPPLLRGDRLYVPVMTSPS